MTVMQDMNVDLPRLAVHSPLALVGAFLYVVRSRFAPENGLTWTWVDNKTDTGILIEAQYEPETEARDIRPGIYVDKDQTVYGKVSIGNRDQNQPGIMRLRQEQYYCIAQTDMLIDCVSTVKGESSTLADMLQQYISFSSKIIQAVFTLQDMSPVVMGRTLPYEGQQNLFSTQITFRVTHEVRWATIPIAPVLRQLGVHIQEVNQGVNTVLADIYTKSIT